MKNDTYSFIVRIWQEAVNNDGDIIVWRGSIDYVGKDKRLYFHDLDGISRFIQDQIGIKSRRSNPWWSSLLAWIRYSISNVHAKLQR